MPVLNICHLDVNCLLVGILCFLLYVSVKIAAAMWLFCNRWRFTVWSFWSHFLGGTFLGFFFFVMFICATGVSKTEIFSDDQHPPEVWVSDKVFEAPFHWLRLSAASVCLSSRLGTDSGRMKRAGRDDTGGTRALLMIQSACQARHPVHSASQSRSDLMVPLMWRSPPTHPRPHHKNKKNKKQFKFKVQMKWGYRLCH